MSISSETTVLAVAPQKKMVSISVRDLVAFVLRSGDLGSGGGFVSVNRALEGTRGHQRLQKSRPQGYEAEVSVSWERDVDDFVFELRGRIDGVFVEKGSLLVEEIKTVDRHWIGPGDPVHWGQAKVYAFLYAREHGFDHCEVQLTYLELDDDNAVQFRERFALDVLEAFFQTVIDEYLEWVREHDHWCRLRDESIRSLEFPFGAYRPGQRALAVAVYRTITAGGKLFAEAPTGIGKTVSVLFPAIKAMAEGRTQKVFYLTAKTIGRTVAEETLQRLRSAGLRLRAVTITAKEKICFNNGQTCDLKTCPFAIGYYDRIKTAMRDAFRSDVFTRKEIEEIARRHQVCPFELSLDLSLWVDAIICDYNYLFDPSASLKRYFDGERHDFAILIDEAHNLVDRAREMFSADLERQELRALKQTLDANLPACAKAIGRIASRIGALPRDESFVDRSGTFASKVPPPKLAAALKKFLETAELWLVRNEPTEFRQGLLEVYFRVLAFRRVLELFDQRYVTIYDAKNGKIRLFCLDPSMLVREALNGTGSTVFFSATLRPIEYFRESLGGDPHTPVLQLASPFPTENLNVFINDRIATTFRQRGNSYAAVAEAIAGMVSAESGNYLVYFPSYEYLRAVLERFRYKYPHYRVEAQSGGMTEGEREQFISLFHSSRSETLVGFAVLGGIFGEGIDLVGERLIGVAVVGVGLPQLCLERDLIREYFQVCGRPGFDYAYTFPGVNRIVQAVGRVIRSESDRGVALLIDHRFGSRKYRQLLPEWWEVKPDSGAAY